MPNMLSECYKVEVIEEDTLVEKPVVEEDTSEL